MLFEELLDNDDLLDAIYDMHYEETTPIQEKSIPVILEGKDLIAVAQTGTGKTAAYLLPIIQRLINDNFPQDKVNCIVMAPTRELAQQIDRVMQGLSYYLPVSSLAIYGGTDGITFEQQRKALKKGADVVIATPGRLKAHLNTSSIDLSEVAFFVLDEADRMLDMGFSEDILMIEKKLPKNRQTLLFSATMPPKIKKLVSQILTDPAEIFIAVSKPAEKIRQEAIVCHEVQKMPILTRYLSNIRDNKILIFASSKIKVKELSKNLKRLNFNISEMHSDLDQKLREDVMLDFKSGKVNIIVATDILSRGIDIEEIHTIINYDVPKDTEDYIHRIGRTARADKEGSALTFISREDIYNFRKIEKLIGEEIEKLPVDPEFGEAPQYSSILTNKTGKKRAHHKNYRHRKSGNSNQQRKKKRRKDSTDAS